MASKPYERFHPGEARGLLDPTWPGVTERGVQETWGRNLASFNERQREKKRERVREVYGTVPPPKRGLLDSEPYTSEWFEGMSDRAYVDSGLRPEHMVGPMAGVRLSGAVKGTPESIYASLPNIGFKKVVEGGTESPLRFGTGLSAPVFSREGIHITLNHGQLARHNNYVVKFGEKPLGHTIISSIHVEKAKRGTKAVLDAVRDLIAMADRTATTLYVQPLPIADKSLESLVKLLGKKKGTTAYQKEKDKLFDLYEKFGFKKAGPMMVRPSPGKTMDDIYIGDEFY